MNIEDLHLRPAEIARLFKVPVGTVRRWAHEDRWARTARPVRYRLLDAQASLARRRHTEPDHGA